MVLDHFQYCGSTNKLYISNVFQAVSSKVARLWHEKITEEHDVSLLDIQKSNLEVQLLWFHLSLSKYILSILFIILINWRVQTEQRHCVWVYFAGLAWCVDDTSVLFCGYASLTPAQLFCYAENSLVPKRPPVLVTLSKMTETLSKDCRAFLSALGRHLREGKHSVKSMERGS